MAVMEITFRLSSSKLTLNMKMHNDFTPETRWTETKHKEFAFRNILHPSTVDKGFFLRTYDRAS
jgi:hypothetical protein